MRGKAVKKSTERTIKRITPAYAGKSPLMTKIFSAGEDHPRLCGEKADLYTQVAGGVGSPPPMRGKD